MLRPQHSGKNSTWFKANKLAIIWLLLMTLGLAALFFVRSSAVDRDFAIANQFSYGILLLLGLMTVVVLLAAGLFRLATYCILLTALGLGMFFSLFRWERLDGELRPRFSWRWSSVPVLPIPPEATNTGGSSLIEMLQPLPSDTPWFLGPNRNASWPDLKVATDWDSHPPQILWRQPIGEGWSSFAVQGKLAVTMEQRGDQEWVSAYDVGTGQILWNYVIPGRYSSSVAGNGPRCTPTIQDDRVFACSAISQFTCLDLQSGELLWSHDLNALASTDRASMENDVNWGRSASPLPYGNAVIIALGGTNQHKDSLIAFDQNSGAQLWRAGGEQISYSSPALISIQSSTQVAYVSATSISGFDPDTGRLLWRVEFEGLGGSPNVAQPLVVDDQHLFFSKGYGIGSRLIRVVRSAADSGDPSDAQWTATIVSENANVLRTKFTNPVLYQEHLYGLSDGILECIDAHSLDRRWKRGRYRHGQLLRLGEHLLVFSEDGRLVLLDADSTAHREIAQFSVLDNVCWNLPALTGNRLLVRNAKEVACVQLPVSVNSGNNSSRATEL
jgi:outer membrane protein assembly factor BamB